MIYTSHYASAQPVAVGHHMCVYSDWQQLVIPPAREDKDLKEQMQLVSIITIRGK